MLLAHKYVILSNLLHHYNMHPDLTLKFSKEDLVKKIGKDDAQILLRQDDSIISIENQLIIIDAKSWMKLFEYELNKLMLTKANNFICKVAEDYKSINFLNNDMLVKKFSINFDPSYYREFIEETIHFCELFSFSYSLYWLNLVNDVNTFDMFYDYLIEHFNKLSFQGNPKILIENLSSDEKRQLFEVGVKGYLNKKYQLTEDILADEKNLLRKFVRNDDFVILKAEMNKQDIFIIQTSNSIEFLGFIKNEISINTVNKQEINKIRERIINKIRELDRISFLTKHNFFRDIQGFYRILSTLGVLSTPLAALLLILDINNVAITIFTSILIILTYHFIFKMVISPQLKISKFSWDI